MGDDTATEGKPKHDKTESNPAFFEHESASFFSSIKPTSSSSMAPQILSVGVVVAVIVFVLRRRVNAAAKELHEKSLA